MLRLPKNSQEILSEQYEDLVSRNVHMVQLRDMLIHKCLNGLHDYDIQFRYLHNRLEQFEEDLIAKIVQKKPIPVNQNDTEWDDNLDAAITNELFCKYEGQRVLVENEWGHLVSKSFYSLIKHGVDEDEMECIMEYLMRYAETVYKIVNLYRLGIGHDLLVEVSSRELHEYDDWEEIIGLRKDLANLLKITIEYQNIRRQKDFDRFAMEGKNSVIRQLPN